VSSERPVLIDGANNHNRPMVPLRSADIKDDPNSQLVKAIIKDAGNMGASCLPWHRRAPVNHVGLSAPFPLDAGAWISHIRSKTNLPQTILQRSIKSLIGQGQIKNVVNVKVRFAFRLSSCRKAADDSRPTLLPVPYEKDLHANRYHAFGGAHWWSLVRRQRS
jgi:hypothetical protein